MSQKVLLEWNSNWADEMDVQGFVIIDEQEWKNQRKALKEKTEEFEICIGTNEYIDYENGKQLLDEISVTKLTDEEAKIITKKIGSEFGFIDFLNLEFEEDF